MIINHDGVVDDNYDAVVVHVDDDGDNEATPPELSCCKHKRSQTGSRRSYFEPGQDDRGMEEITIVIVDFGEGHYVHDNGN